jgi:methylamine dehydrogenase accessory protein MauD
MTGPLLASYIVLWGLVLVQAVAILALYQHFGQMYLTSRVGRESQGPALGTAFTRVKVRDIRGEPIALPPIGIPSLILFASTTCSLCSKLLPELEMLARTRSDIRTLIVCAGNRKSVQAWTEGLTELVPVVPDPGYAIAAQYDIALTPFCVACDESGTIRAKGLVNDRAGLLVAINEALSGDFAPNIVEAGTVT